MVGREYTFPWCGLPPPFSKIFLSYVLKHNFQTRMLDFNPLKGQQFYYNKLTFNASIFPLMQYGT